MMTTLATNQRLFYSISIFVSCFCELFLPTTTTTKIIILVLTGPRYNSSSRDKQKHKSSTIYELKKNMASPIFHVRSLLLLGTFTVQTSKNCDFLFTSLNQTFPPSCNNPIYNVQSKCVALSCWHFQVDIHVQRVPFILLLPLTILFLHLRKCRLHTLADKTGTKCRKKNIITASPVLVKIYWKEK